MLRAFLNERAQITFNVAGFATLYPSLASASWRMQIRPSPGSPTLYFDFEVSGEATYSATPIASIEFQASTSAIAAIPPGRWAYDFGFVLPSADFERAGGGFVVFLPGVTEAGVTGSPSPPSGSDDTWLPIGDSAPDFLSTAAAAAASANAAAASAAAAEAAEAGVSADATAAANSAAAAAGSAAAAANSAGAAVTSATSAASSASAASTFSAAAAVSASAAAASAAEFGVTSLAALAAITPSVGQGVNLIAGGRSGLFTWDPANLSSQVTNDPGQGVYVAPPTIIVVSGTLSPNVTGNYTQAGAFNGNPYYTNGTYFLWYYFPSIGFWVISTAPGTNTPSFFVQSKTALPPNGNYAPQGGYTGTAVVAGGSVLSGTLGAWVRQSSGPTDDAFFGSVGDGVLTPATGTILLPTNPTAGQTVTVGTTVLTAVASGATGNQFNIGGTAPITVASLLTLLQASTDGQISQCLYALDASVLTTIHVTYNMASPNDGGLGNSFVMSTTVTGGTAAALSGGSATGTDNSQALANIGVYGRYITSLNGIGYTRFARPGVYLFSFNNTVGCCWNWGKSKHLLADTAWFNTDTPGTDWPWFVFTSATHPLGYLIASTAVGATSVTLLTPSQISNFNVGDYVMESSLCVQPNGFPGNTQNFEFNTVTAINSATGLITLSKPLKYAHLSTYPDGIQAGSEACGAARIWALNCVPSPTTPALTAIPVPVVRFDSEVEIIGPIKVFYGQRSGSQVPYLTVNARSWKTYKWNGPAFSLSRVERAKHEFDTYLTATVIDKQVGPVEYDNCNFIGLFSPQNPTEFVTARYCSFPGGLQSGPIKQLLVEQCEINSLALGGNILGYSRKQSFINNRIYNISGAHYAVDGLGPLASVDGTNISYSNVSGYTVIRGLLSANQFLSALPGSQVFFGTAGINFGGDIAVGTVLATDQDATYSYIHTDFPFASLPAANVCQLVQLYDIEFRGNTGCDLARLFSDACEGGSIVAGVSNPRYFERQRLLFDNNSAPSASSINSSAGVLVGVYANVRKAGTGTCGVKLSWASIVNSTTLAIASFPGLTINIDGSQKGIRNITQFVWAGNAGADAITVNGGSTLSQLPTDSVGGFSIVQLAMSYTYTTGSGLAPIIEIILQFDCGMFRKIIDFAGSGTTALVNTTGPCQP